MVLATKSLALALVLAAAGAAPAVAVGGFLGGGLGGAGLDGIMGKATGKVQGDGDLPAGLHVEPTLDLEGAPDQFRGRLDAGALLNESGVMVAPDLAAEVTDEQAHVNTHLVASHEDKRAGAFSGVDIYTPDDAPPRVEVHETQNLDGPVEGSLDTHAGIDVPGLPS